MATNKTLRNREVEANRAQYEWEQKSDPLGLEGTGKLRYYLISKKRVLYSYRTLTATLEAMKRRGKRWPVEEIFRSKSKDPRVDLSTEIWNSKDGWYHDRLSASEKHELEEFYGNWGK